MTSAAPAELPPLTEFHDVGFCSTKSFEETRAAKCGFSKESGGFWLSRCRFTTFSPGTTAPDTRNSHVDARRARHCAPCDATALCCELNIVEFLFGRGALRMFRTVSVVLAFLGIRTCNIKSKA